jgi:hypothetical protein
MLRFVAPAQGTGMVLVLYIEQRPYLNAIAKLFMSTKIQYPKIMNKYEYMTELVLYLHTFYL